MKKWVTGHEAQGVAESPASSVQRHGERPSQQIRKAKATARRQFSAEDKIRIVMEGICRRERLHTTIYYRWLKDFMEAGKRRLRGDIQAATGTQCQGTGVLAL